MIGETVFTLPQQLNVFEIGEDNGLPLANEAFTTQWHDTWRPFFESIIIVQTGGNVFTGDPANLPAGPVLRPTGLYFLDLFFHHANADVLPLQVLVRGLPTVALLTAPIVTVSRIAEYIVPSGVNFTTSLRVSTRLFLVQWTYPNVNAGFFRATAVLRGQ
jgi:hypothetical protein